MKNIRFFLSENFQFLVVKFSIYFEQACFRNGTKSTGSVKPRKSNKVIDRVPLVLTNSILLPQNLHDTLVEELAFALPKRKNKAFAKSPPLRKQAYSNILKILPPKNENFQIKNSDIFLISAQNIDCGYSLEPPRRCGSNEYPQSMF